MCLLSNQLQEINKEVTSKQENLCKATRMINNRSTRLEEYTVQILNVLETIHSQRVVNSDQADTDQVEVCSSATVPLDFPQDSQHNPWVFPPAGSVRAKPFRMMSVPAHIHRKQMSRQVSRDLIEDPDTPSYPLYFRRKFPQTQTQRFAEK